MKSIDRFPTPVLSIVLLVALVALAGGSSWLARPAVQAAPTATCGGEFVATADAVISEAEPTRIRLAAGSSTAMEWSLMKLRTRWKCIRWKTLFQWTQR